jgi:two-component system chemotaxis response regulator CheY
VINKRRSALRAIVIDDSRAIRSILGNILKELGFEVTDAKHGLEALEKLRELGPLDLALVDWNMPEMNGLEFVKSVRANQSLQNMVLMMVTTETETSQMMAALDAGANEYVMKPFTKEVILDKLCLLGLKQGA